METFHKKEKNINLGAILLGCDGRTFKGKDGLDSQAEPKKRTIDSNLLFSSKTPGKKDLLILKC